jgi:Flp pilus assembly protein TadD
MELSYASANAEIYVKGPNGAPIDKPVTVVLLRTGGQLYAKDVTKAGFVKFERVPYSEFTAQIIEPGYQPVTKHFEVDGPGAVTVTLNLEPLEAEAAAASIGFYSLSPKVQKDAAKALEALRANKPSGALNHLQAAQRGAPNSAEIEYLFGVYASQVNDPVGAKSHWMKTLQLNPNHLSALLAVGQNLLHENRSAEALTYLRRAADTSPTAWRAHALLAEALVLQHQDADAVKEARRAQELGHEQAAVVQPVLARALADTGEREEAVRVLQGYVQTHPTDTAASKNLEILKNPDVKITPSDAAAEASEMSALSKEAASLPLSANWLPPDVDESVPPVVAGKSCDLDDVVSKAGKRITELISDVDRYAATETLTHESIDKNGIASAPEKRKFNYVASIQEVRHGYLIVQEYRSAPGGGPAEFPGGVATNGLPALVLIFHPYNAPDFAMTCEGLARLSDGLAWQIHFRQRPDKPNVIKTYRVGADSPSHPVALKGRAWISADTFQIMRLEADLVAPMKEIRLLEDRADIEYGPVHFAKGNVNMWLPKRADVYYDWRGRRIHRRHSFGDYMLFAVDDKQKISAPKVDEARADTSPGEPPKQKP